MPLGKGKHSVRKLNDFDGRMRSSDLTVQHTRHAPRVAHTLRVVAEHRCGDDAVRGNVLIQLCLPLGRKRSFGCLNIQFLGGERLPFYVCRQFIRTARDVTVGLESGLPYSTCQ